MKAGAGRVLPVGMLVMAAGRFPELVFAQPKDTPASDDTADAGTDSPLRWEAVEAHKKSPDRDQTGFFAPGDAQSDYGAAIKAIGAGRRGAASIHKIMYGISLYVPDNTVNPDAVIQDVDHVDDVACVARGIMPLADGTDAGELEKGFGEEMARREADRCLQCGLICYQRTGQNTAAR